MEAEVNALASYSRVGSELSKDRDSVNNKIASLRVHLKDIFVNTEQSYRVAGTPLNESIRILQRCSSKEKVLRSKIIEECLLLREALKKFIRKLSKRSSNLRKCISSKSSDSKLIIESPNIGKTLEECLSEVPDSVMKGVVSLSSEELEKLNSFLQILAL